MKKWVFAGIGVLIIGAASVYGLMVVRSSSLISTLLEQAGYPQAVVINERVYFDGVVIGDIALTPEKHLQRVYIQANPWQQIAHAPQSVSVEKADLTLTDFFKEKIGFLDGIPFDVQSLKLRLPNLLGKAEISVRIKQNAATGALFTFKTKSEEARLSGQGEVYFNDGIVTNINLDISKLTFESDKIQIKRGDGWLSFIYKEKWLVTGELGAGYAGVNGMELADASVTFNGEAQNPSWNLIGKDKKTDESVALEANGASIKTAYKDETFEHETQNLFDAFAQAEADIRSIKPPLEVVVVKQRPKAVARPIEKEKGTETIPQETFQVVETPLVRKNAEELFRNTFFEGFQYSGELVLIDVPCPSVTDTGCWTARARGGVLSYDGIPAYFSRMKDYAASTALRRMMQSLKIKTIALEGKGSQAQELAVIGQSETGQPVHIELSVEDLN